jgi:hypothetical protein
MSINEQQASRSSTLAGKIFLFAILLGLFATYLFFQRPLGISVFVFVLAGLLILFGLGIFNNIKPSLKNAWLVIPLVLFASLVSVRANGFTAFLNISAVLILCLLLAYLFQSGNILKFSILNYLSSSIQSGIEIGILRPPSASAQAWKEAQQNGGVSPRLAAISRGLLLALPVVIVFAILFSSADAAFELAARDFLRFLRLDNLPELVARLVFTLFAAWLCLGGLSYALRESQPTSTNNGRPSQPTWKLGFTETAVVLGSVNALFAAFVIIQFRYFFGGQKNISVAGFSYAEYTHRGFAELVIVAIFTLGLCLILQAITRKDSPFARWGFEGLVFLLVLFTGVVLVSAFQRLVLYEQAYGWTQLRTYVHVFMLCLGILLVCFLFSVHFTNPRFFAHGVFLTFLGFILILNILNTDAFIARQNIARYAETGQLDVIYLATLSDDANSELLWLLNAAKQEDAQVIGSALHDRLDRLEESQKRSGWPGWNWSRHKALQKLQQARPLLENYPPKQYHWNFPID